MSIKYEIKNCPAYNAPWCTDTSDSCKFVRKCSARADCLLKQIVDTLTKGAFLASLTMTSECAEKQILDKFEIVKVD